ncbi:MAG: UDP-N-acetylglucosamine--N-acetylmuramyl-(pentapeptide) pyrophosphoryl-undecaprenol N-acetylglucosamine transferase [Leptospiraceae bacterium]|nr:UDP-N-acetylglucosamine--N-acetylmuramyl-(pentapeptide) pyrophosphoryl-undecaprenol N-acetylglucosamine transferase [Leptospiraceae bacterium]MDW8307469.1 UDP-N-acetylglucosamine--N-acetylmuramyl-(pentapeptide) pyrophosphoryl-undecaprenol N-acetylglucosamine transferase [Leptospiraceae bacterium]
MEKKEKAIFIAAGGTGGHISPGVALAEGFLKKKVRVVFFSLEKDRDYPDLERLRMFEGVHVVFYKAPPLPSKVWLWPRFAKNLILSLGQVREQHKLYQVVAAIGMGGYPAFPLLLYSKFMKIPYFLCEQNSVMGFVSQLFAKRAQKVFLSFPMKTNASHYVFTGNPLRSQFQKKVVVRKPTSFRKILIVGGSQGARDLNELYLRMIEDPFFENWQIILSTGKNHYHAIYPKKRKKDQILPFITDMPRFLTNCDVVLCRAGSGTLYEVIWAQKPSVLFPFPYATKNHQYYNALYLKEQGVSEIIDIRPFSAKEAVCRLKEILQSHKLKEMADAVAQKKVLPLTAHEVIVNEVLQLA